MWGMMNRNLLMGLGTFVLIGALYVFFGMTGNVVGSGEAQEITIDMKNWVYSPSVVRVEARVPVRIYLTDNVRGCFRDLIIPEMDIRKRFASSEDYIEVTFPEGSYTFACSMYMGTGRIIAK